MRRTSIGRGVVVTVAMAIVLAPGVASARLSGVLASVARMDRARAGGAPAVAASVASPPKWHTVATVPSPSILLGVGAAAPAQAWAVGWGGSLTKVVPVVRAWNGASWAAVSLPSGVVSALGLSPVLVTTAASGPANVWAFTESGRWLHGKGTRWTAGRIATPAPVIQSSLAIGPDSAWAFGGKAASGGQSAVTPYAGHFTPGHGWHRTLVPGKGMIVAVSEVTYSDIWAVIGTGSLGGTASGSGLVHWTAGHWHAVTSLPVQLRNASLGAVFARSDSDVWVGGAVSNRAHGTTEAVGHWNGHSWTVTTLPAVVTAAKFHVVSIVPDGVGGLWALGFSIGQTGNAIESRLWHQSAGRWTGPVNPALAHRAAALVGLAATGNSVWGIGDAGVSTRRPNGLIALWGPTP